MAGWRRLLSRARSFESRNASPTFSSASTAPRITNFNQSNLFSDTSSGTRVSSFWGGLLFGQQLHKKHVRDISTSRSPLLSPLAGGKEQPVRSPLTMVPAVTDRRKGGNKEEGEKRAVQAVLKKIKQSPKKVNLVAALVRGMRVEDALLQLAVTQKRAAKTVKRVVANARANATHNHGLNGDRLFVAEAFVGKGKYLKRLSYHAKGRSGIMHHPSCRLTVIVKEMSPQQEAELARYKTMTFRERAKFKSKLVPHRLIETSWQWHRTPKEVSSSADASQKFATPE